MKIKGWGIISLIVICIMMSALAAGCGKKEKKKDVSIVCTIFPQYDFVRQLTKDMENVEVKMLLKPGQESHDYDPSSKDIMAVHEADLFIYVGGESDTWIKDVLATVKNKNQKALAIIDVLSHEHDEDEHEANEYDEDMNKEAEHAEASDAGSHGGLVMEGHEGHDHGYDEHVWTSLEYAIDIVHMIYEELESMEAIDKEALEKNMTQYTNELKGLQKDFDTCVTNGNKDIIVVADRFPLLYFCEEFGLKYHGAFAGCATSVEPSTATLLELISTVKENDLKYIFIMEMSAGNTAKQVAAETGAEILTFYSCHNVTSEQLKSNVTYVELMKTNLEALKKALE